jgi:hypothetical protein
MISVRRKEFEETESSTMGLSSGVPTKMQARLPNTFISRSKIANNLKIVKLENFQKQNQTALKNLQTDSSIQLKTMSQANAVCLVPRTINMKISKGRLSPLIIQSNETTEINDLGNTSISEKVRQDMQKIKRRSSIGTYNSNSESEKL